MHSATTGHAPGRIWVAELPEDIRAYSQENQLKLEPLVSGLYKNHGFCRCEEDGYGFVMVGTENGVYKVTPPSVKGGEWKAELELEVPASDMLETVRGNCWCSLLSTEIHFPYIRK